MWALERCDGVTMLEGGARIHSSHAHDLVLVFTGEAVILES